MSAVLLDQALTFGDLAAILVVISCSCWFAWRVSVGSFLVTLVPITADFGTSGVGEVSRAQLLGLVGCRRILCVVRVRLRRSTQVLSQWCVPRLHQVDEPHGPQDKAGVHCLARAWSCGHTHA